MWLWSLWFTQWLWHFYFPLCLLQSWPLHEPRARQLQALALLQPFGLNLTGWTDAAPSTPGTHPAAISSRNGYHKASPPGVESVLNAPGRNTHLTSLKDSRPIGSSSLLPADWNFRVRARLGQGMSRALKELYAYQLVMLASANPTGPRCKYQRTGKTI